MLLTRRSTIDTIKVFIYYAYDNLKMRGEITRGRKRFMIPNHFFEKHKLENNDSLDSPASKCMFVWSDKYLKS